ncbi:MAG: branched-chain amino acid ABC transporter substrate-binding protein [Actinomycetota bacterium]|nr:branched-chain amino acid ABC transporter substrate-binding protein [Actinomycetota bacterium]
MKKVLVLAFVAAGLAASAAAFASNSGSSAQARPGAAGKGLIACGKTRTIGVLAPTTGPAASLGLQQVKWMKHYVNGYNKAHKKTKVKLKIADTQLGNGVTFAVAAAASLAADPKVLATVGPAGSNEVRATTATLKTAGLGFVSGSATNTQIATDGTRKGYFFRTVPPDRVQSSAVANFIAKAKKWKRVYIIDDQEAYSTGLADESQAKLRSAGVTVKRDGVNQNQSDFSSVIAKIPRNYQVVYLPWQLPPKAQAFGRQLKQAGKGNIALMGSDGLYDTAFSGLGKNVYDTMFPVNPRAKVVKSYKKAHKGVGDFFGAPSFAATQVIAGALDRACKNKTATRTEVRSQLKRTRIRGSVLGLPIKFDKNGDLRGGSFGVYKSDGKNFQPV